MTIVLTTVPYFVRDLVRAGVCPCSPGLQSAVACSGSAALGLGHGLGGHSRSRQITAANSSVSLACAALQCSHYIYICTSGSKAKYFLEYLFHQWAASNTWEQASAVSG